MTCKHSCVRLGGKGPNHCRCGCGLGSPAHSAAARRAQHCPPLHPPNHVSLPSAPSQPALSRFPVTQEYFSVTHATMYSTLSLFATLPNTKLDFFPVLWEILGTESQAHKTQLAVSHQMQATRKQKQALFGIETLEGQTQEPGVTMCRHPASCSHHSSIRATLTWARSSSSSPTRRRKRSRWLQSTLTIVRSPPLSPGPTALKTT